MVEKLSTNELKSLADSLVRGFLIKKAEKNDFGKIYCPITKKWMSEDKLHVCHIVDRNRMSTRYSPANVFLGSAYSNLFESKVMCQGYQSLHHKKIQDAFGEELIDFLKEMAKERKLYSREEYLDLINFFKEEINGGDNRQHAVVEEQY